MGVRPSVADSKGKDLTGEGKSARKTLSGELVKSLNAVAPKQHIVDLPQQFFSVT